MRNYKINSLNDLYKQLDFLYKDIYKSCRVCKEKDCKGYVWILPEEVQNLSNEISLIEINKKCYFIDSFKRKSGTIDIEELSPPCVLRNHDKKCLIYPYRPLNCRLYPLDFKIIEKEVYIVIHTDCLFVKKLIENGTILLFLEKVSKVFYNCNEKLLKPILEHYQEINSIFKYPKDYKHDDYFKFLKVVNNFKTIRIKKLSMSKCKAVLDSKKIKEIKVKGKQKMAKNPKKLDRTK